MTQGHSIQAVGHQVMYNHDLITKFKVAFHLFANIYLLNSLEQEAKLALDFIINEVKTLYLLYMTNR